MIKAKVKIMSDYHFPFSRSERKKRAKKLTRDFCNKCEKSGVHKECSDCWVHWMINQIAGE